MSACGSGTAVWEDAPLACPGVDCDGPQDRPANVHDGLQNHLSPEKEAHDCDASKRLCVEVALGKPTVPCLVAPVALPGIDEANARRVLVAVALCIGSK